MKGVTLTVFRRHFGSSKSKNDLRNITDDQLDKVYKHGYWDKCKCGELPAGVDYAVFDAAVNSGPGRGARWLQGAVGAVQDGAIGVKTLERVASKDPSAIIDDMLDQRLRFLRGLRTFATFGRGWKRRVKGVRETALRMAGGDVTTASITPDVDFETVRSGSNGVWVTKLQNALGIQADGKFGPKTDAALRAFQEANGLEPDGIAGRNSYRALGLIG